MVRNILPEGVECVRLSNLASGTRSSAPSVSMSTSRLPYSWQTTSSWRPVSVMKVEGEDISKYGVVVPGEIDGSVRGLIEKPKYEDAPSDLASIGRYVLTPDVFEILRGQEPGAAGEIQLADAINKMAITGDVASTVLGGRRFDCGSVRGYLDATMAMAERRARKV